MGRFKTNEEKQMTAFKRLSSDCGTNFVFEDGYDYISLRNAFYRKSKIARVAMVDTHRPSSPDELKGLVDALDMMGKGVTLEKMTLLYGETDGYERYRSYCDKQANTNTFEYKRDVYGWTEEMFSAYNKSRAVTLENMISRHGEDEGRVLYQKYCDIQAFTNTKEHLGDRYEEVCKLKGHSYDSYLLRYGDETIAKDKFAIFFDRHTPSYSNKSQELFRMLDERILEDSYYATKGGEYGVNDFDVSGKYYKYDYVCPSRKLVVEFHGDHYHGNPALYEANDFLKGRGMTKTMASEKWGIDDIKNDAIKRLRGFDVVVVWEKDYDDGAEAVVERIVEYASKIH